MPTKKVGLNKKRACEKKKNVRVKESVSGIRVCLVKVYGEKKCRWRKKQVMFGKNDVWEKCLGKDVCVKSVMCGCKKCVEANKVVF